MGLTIFYKIVLHNIVMDLNNVMNWFWFHLLYNLVEVRDIFDWWSCLQWSCRIIAGPMEKYKNIMMQTRVHIQHHFCDNIHPLWVKWDSGSWVCVWDSWRGMYVLLMWPLFFIGACCWEHAPNADVCYDEIELCAQNTWTVPRSTVNIIKNVYLIN